MIFIKKNILLLFVLAAFCSHAQPIDTIVPVAVSPTIVSDRPGQTYTPITLKKNTWQLQMGVNWGGVFGKQLGVEYNALGYPIDLRYGVTDKFELMASPSFNFASSPVDGGGIEYTLSTYALTGRYSLFRNKPFGSAALMATYQFETYARGTETSNNGVFKFLYTIPFAQNFSFNTNLGATISSYHSTTFDFTLNLAGPVTEKVGFFLELFGNIDTELETGEVHPISIDLGLSYLSSNRFQVDGGFTQAIQGSQTYYGFLGISYLML